MKKKHAVLCCAMGLVVALTGCASSGSLIKSYTDTTLSDKSSLLSSSQNQALDFFASSLAIFPKEGVALSVQESTGGSDTPADTSPDSESYETESDTTVYETESSVLMAETDSGESTTETEVEAEPEIDSASALLAGIDSHESLFSKNIYERRAPASITKIMTALLTLENCDFSEEVTFTQDMVVTEPEATLCYLEVGDVLTVEQLFNGLLIQSGNDAANALAIHIAGSIDGFSEMMNQRARELGCVDTHFVNPSGLHDDDHYTSAYDIYLMFNECLKHEEFVSTIRQSEYTATYKNGSGQTVSEDYTTTNQYFLDYYDYPEGVRVIGGKTGTTDQAGRCLILYDTNTAGEGFISVILGADSGEMLYSEMNELLNKIPN